MATIRQDSVGVRVRDLRRQRGMSQAQLAHPELSDSYVSLIESGKRSPTEAVITVLAAKLECSPTYLINGVTAEELATIEMGLSFARLALDNGEVEEARVRLAELLTDEHLGSLEDLKNDVEFYYVAALEATGELRQAADRLEGLRAAGERDVPRRIAVVLALCRCLRELGELSESIRVGEQALAEESTGGWSDDVVELGSTLLASYIFRGDRVRSKQLANTLLSKAEAMGTPRAVVAACWNAALVAMDAGQSEYALQLVGRALAVQSETGPPRNLARLQEAHGSLLMDADPSNAGRAREALIKAKVALSESATSTYDMMRLTVALARAELMLGRPAQALDLVHGILEEPNTQSAQVALAEIHLLRALAFQSLRDPSSAAEALEAAAGLLEDMQASHKAAQAWFELAEQLTDLGNSEQSKTAFHRALSSVGL